MARIGYARVSTTDEDPDIQIGRLKTAGCEIIRSEVGSGASRSGRTELDTIMQFLHAGDELVVLRLDRLDRSTRDVLNLVHELEEKGASLRVIEPEVTTAAMSRQHRKPSCLTTAGTLCGGPPAGHSQ